MKTVRGFEALGYLTAAEFLPDNIEITEHMTGIDVDNAGRSYDREYSITRGELYWVALNYLKSTEELTKGGFTMDDLYSLEYDEELCGATDTKIRWFHIHEDIFDSESRGIHFEFYYPEAAK